MLGNTHSAHHIDTDCPELVAAAEHGTGVVGCEVVVVCAVAAEVETAATLVLSIIHRPMRSTRGGKIHSVRMGSSSGRRNSGGGGGRGAIGGVGVISGNSRCERR